MTPVIVDDDRNARAGEAATDPVRDFYSAHPYPPPVDNLDRARDEWRDPGRRRAEYHRFWPDRPYRADLEILVAGCGTWQAARYALCHPDAQVLGVDVSSTSLLHTERLKQRYNLTNLETRQLSIEDLAAGDRRFDLIVCTGVLHHLADPDAGLRALQSVLTADGAIYAMVYAPYGRTGITMIQEYCRRLGVGTSAREIDDLVATLRALPRTHPLATALGAAHDAASPDALADALLNPRDRTYSVRELFDFLDRTGCGFARWYTQAPYLPQCGAPSGTPHARRLRTLPERERYAAMELWRGTMTTHSVVAYRNDRPHTRHVAFDDDRWRGFIPLRLPWTTCVQERLPAGAAAVLLNRSHTYPDLILPVDAEEKRLFDGIDGLRDVAAIVGRNDERLWARARTLFERLWQYDQVVFDTSAAD